MIDRTLVVGALSCALASGGFMAVVMAVALRLVPPEEPMPVPVCVHVEPLPVCAPDLGALQHLDWCIEELQTCDVMMGLDSDLDDTEEEGREL